MHELPVTESIVKVAVEAAEANGGGRITAVNLVIGDMSSFVDQSIQFYFDILSKGTLAEGAELRFQRQPALVTCCDCGHQVEVSPPLFPECPACRSTLLVVTGGREFFIDSIEVEE